MIHYTHYINSHFLNLYEQYFIRSPEKWKLNTRSYDSDKIVLSFFQYVFGKYKTPSFLNKSVLEAYNFLLSNKQVRIRQNQTHIDFIMYYITIASGGSLYKTQTKDFLTKKETSNFIKYGVDDLTGYQNLWFARCITKGCPVGWAKNISRTLDRLSATPFHLEVMNFFIENPVKQIEMVHLFDWMKSIHNDNPFFSLKKRTLESVRVLSEEWHRLQGKKKKYSRLYWSGHPIDNWEQEDGAKKRWSIQQIVSADDLIEEGHKMRHCVASYAYVCQQGSSSIWTVKFKETTDSKFHRALTLEVGDDGMNFYLRQVRGLANRLPVKEEMEVVKQWASENEIISRGYY